MGPAPLQSGIDPMDERAVVEMVQQGRARVDIRFEGGRQQTLLNGENVDEAIRTQEAGSAASAVSRCPEVRRYLAARQQKLAENISMIVDGRDIGTVVLPGAKAKIFLSAAPEVRARRRYEQLLQKGMPADYEEVLKELIARDRQDTERKTDPLRRAEDAVALDTSTLTFNESVEAILAIVKEAYDN